MPGTPVLLRLAFIEAVYFLVSLGEINSDINCSRKTNRRGNEVQQKELRPALGIGPNRVKNPAQTLRKTP